jgi:hypothetical protein
MRDRETTTEAQWEPRKTRALDLAAQEQDYNGATVTCSKQKYELNNRGQAMVHHRTNPTANSNACKNQAEKYDRRTISCDDWAGSKTRAGSNYESDTRELTPVDRTEAGGAHARENQTRLGRRLHEAGAGTKIPGSRPVRSHAGSKMIGKSKICHWLSRSWTSSVPQCRTLCGPAYTRRGKQRWEKRNQIGIVRGKVMRRTRSSMNLQAGNPNWIWPDHMREGLEPRVGLSEFSPHGTKRNPRPRKSNTRLRLGCWLRQHTSNGEWKTTQAREQTWEDAQIGQLKIRPSNMNSSTKSNVFSP